MKTLYAQYGKYNQERTKQSPTHPQRATIDTDTGPSGGIPTHLYAKEILLVMIVSLPRDCTSIHTRQGKSEFPTSHNWKAGGLCCQSWGSNRELTQRVLAKSAARPGEALPTPSGALPPCALRRGTAGPQTHHNRSGWAAPRLVRCLPQPQPTP